MNRELWLKKKEVAKRPRRNPFNGLRHAFVDRSTLFEQKPISDKGALWRANQKLRPEPVRIAFKKSAPTRAYLARDLEFRKRDTRSARAKRHRAASLKETV